MAVFFVATYEFLSQETGPLTTPLPREYGGRGGHLGGGEAEAGAALQETVGLRLRGRHVIWRTAGKGAPPAPRTTHAGTCSL